MYGVSAGRGQMFTALLGCLPDVSEQCIPFCCVHNLRHIAVSIICGIMQVFPLQSISKSSCGNTIGGFAKTPSGTGGFSSFDLSMCL